MYEWIESIINGIGGWFQQLGEGITQWISQNQGTLATIGIFVLVGMVVYVFLFDDSK
jgi:hypothetical protein